MLSIKTGSSTAENPQIAVKELFEAINQPDASFVLFYCSNEYDLSGVETALNTYFSDTDIIGCTSYAEISTFGYNKRSIIGLSIASPEFNVVTERIGNLSGFQLQQGEATATTLLDQLGEKVGDLDHQQVFGFLLIDGLSLREEFVAASLSNTLGDIPFFGGSAADGERFQSTHVFHGGSFHADSAVFSLIHTTAPFQVFKTDHFTKISDDVVVTGANISERRVYEINGIPAIEEFARISGVKELNEVTQYSFVEHPFSVQFGEEDAIRSIMRLSEDQSLQFTSLMEEGMILNLTEAGDLLSNLNELMQEIHDHIGRPQLILGCDCMFRTMELERNGILEEADKIYAANNLFGFSTYGEQFNGLQCNQTFTGVAIGF